MKKSSTSFLATALVVAGWSGAAMAQSATVTGNLQVKITIAKECQVNASSSGAGGGDAVLDFGTQGVLNADVDGQTASSGTGSLQVQCTNGVPYSIGLGNGQNGTDASSRKMKGGTETVAYQLYKSSARTDIWGDGNNGATGKTATANGTVQSHQVFGRVPPQNTPAAGAYTDVVQITVAY